MIKLFRRGSVSKIFFPYVYHGSIAHKYYINMGYTIKPQGIKKRFSTIFSTGIRENYDSELETAYLRLLDQLILYDTIMIPVEDVVYLVGTIGMDFTLRLINENCIKPYDALSNKIGTYYGPENSLMIFNEFQSELDDLITARVDKNIKVNERLMHFEPSWRDVICEIFKKAYFINDIKYLFKQTRRDLNDEIVKDEIKSILELSPSINSINLKDEQIKANRLLHYHYYRRISELLHCDYMYVPVELEELYNHYIEKTYSSKDDLDNIFSQITKLENIPDIPELLANKTLSIGDILDIRNSKEAKKFRTWIDKINKSEIDKSTPEIYAKLYHEACMSNNKFKKQYNSKTGAAIRTLGLLSISSLNPAAGIGITIVDYLVSNGLNNYNPSTFTREKLREVIRKKQTK